MTKSISKAARRLVFLAATAGLLAGCSTMTMQNQLTTEPELREISTTTAALRTLPPPAKPVTVAVYALPDLTGQFSETTSGAQSLSHAVTQDGVALLIKSLQDAGQRRWFTVLDRSRLDNTLKERQIVSEMRRIYRGEQTISASAMPPLMHAGIIIEGSITGYDSYLRTGGLGAQYLGIGGSTRWQQDTVTVNLRAVSTATSEVLTSVTVQKQIASVAAQGSVFRYVALDKILEIEGGVTVNEPKQIAVEKAIDKAVDALIMEGVRSGIWSFANKQDGSVALTAYLTEMYGEEIPAGAEHLRMPVTRNPTAVVKTIPVSQAAQQPQSAPPAQEPQASGATPMNLPAVPPPANPDEIIG